MDSKFIQKCGRYMWVVASILLVASMFLTQPASAGKNQPPEPTAVDLLQRLTDAGDKAGEKFAQMSPAQQEKVVESLKVVRIESQVVEVKNGSTSSAGILASGCKGYIRSRSGYNLLGGKLWSYFQRIDWCYNGSKVTSTYRNRWGETYYPFWNWQHNGNSTSGGTGSTYYYAWTQGQFALCVNGQGWGCIQYSYPWVDQRGDKNGNYTSNGGG